MKRTTVTCDVCGKAAGLAYDGSVRARYLDGTGSASRLVDRNVDLCRACLEQVLATLRIARKIDEGDQ